MIIKGDRFMKIMDLYQIYLMQQKEFSGSQEESHHDTHYDQGHIDSVDHEDN